MNDFLLFVPVDNLLEVLVDSCHFLALKSAVLLLNSKTLNLSAAIKKSSLTYYKFSFLHISCITCTFTDSCTV